MKNLLKTENNMAAKTVYKKIEECDKSEFCNNKTCKCIRGYVIRGEGMDRRCVHEKKGLSEGAIIGIVVGVILFFICSKIMSLLDT